jgi:predicted Zn-dependent protease
VAHRQEAEGLLRAEANEVMMAEGLRKLIACLGVVLLLTAALAGPARADLSIDDERKLGEKFLRAAFRQLDFVEDREVVDYVDGIGQRLVEHLGVHTFPYHFYVVDSSVLNAFAAPAGHVFINRGLLEIMENEGELAAILAHEIAHVQSRHIAHRLARSQTLSLAALGGMVAGLFLGGSSDASQAILTGTLAGTASLELSYSRQDEEEADRKGLRYLEATGYAGSDMVGIMKKMGQQSWKAGGSIPTYLSTHPGVAERVNYLAGTLETRRDAGGAPDGEAGDSSAFRLMQARLLGQYQDPHRSEAILKRWVEDEETRAMGLFGIGLVQRRQGKMAEAAESLTRALASRPDLTPCMLELGETYFQMGKLDKAVSALESALARDPNQPAALYLLGRCFLQQGDAAKARQELVAALQLNDRIPSIHYHLGMAYGKLNELGEAHYHFGLHHHQEGTWRSARFHFQEALRHTKDPERREEIRRALKGVHEEEPPETSDKEREEPRNGHPELGLLVRNNPVG